MRPNPRAGVVRPIVSMRALRRSLLILQAIFTEAEHRGWEVSPSKRSPAGVAIVVRGHAYAVSIAELHDRAPMADDDFARWRRQKEWRLRWEHDLKPPTLKSIPDGRLKLSLPSTWHSDRNSWSEGPRGPLEAKLGKFFEELARRADADDRRAEERAREEDVRRQHELERIEQERLARIENARAARLAEEVAAWRRARDVREYIAALRDQLGTLDGETRERVRLWCEWAEIYAARSDPVANSCRVQGIEVEPAPTSPWQ